MEFADARNGDPGPAPMKSFRTRLRSVIRFVGAAALSGITLWLAARNVHVDGLQGAIARANFLWLIPYPAMCIALNLIRGEIWRRFLDRRVSSAQAFWAYSIGFVVNNVLPFRLGEAARVVVLSTRGELPILEVAAAAGLERLLDIGILSLLVALAGPAAADSTGVMHSAALAAVVAVGGLMAIVALARFRDRPPDILDRAVSVLPPGARRVLVERWRDLIRGMAVLLRPSVGLPAVSAAMVVWILTVAMQWLVLRAFQPLAGVADAAFMVGAVSLASALPAAPGFIGIYHWAVQQSLTSAFPQLYDASTALAAATVAH